MRYFRLRPLPWREFLLPYVSLFSSIALSTNLVLFPIPAPDYTCYRDSANTPRCSLYTSYTITRTTSTPTLTSTSPRPTSTSDSNDDDNSDDPPDVPDSDSDNSDSNSNSSGNNSTSSSSTRTSSSLRSTSSGTAAGAASGAKGLKGSSSFFGLAPVLVLMGVCVW